MPDVEGANRPDMPDPSRPSDGRSVAGLKKPEASRSRAALSRSGVEPSRAKPWVWVHRAEPSRANQNTGFLRLAYSSARLAGSATVCAAHPPQNQPLLRAAHTFPIILQAAIIIHIPYTTCCCTRSQKNQPIQQRTDFSQFRCGLGG